DDRPTMKTALWPPNSPPGRVPPLPSRCVLSVVERERASTGSTLDGGLRSLRIALSRRAGRGRGAASAKRPLAAVVVVVRSSAVVRSSRLQHLHFPYRVLRSSIRPPA